MAKSEETPRSYLIAAAVLAAVALVFAGYTWWRNYSSGVSGSDYQAVFLTNDQVYFGKVSSQNSEQLVLTDVYYLRNNPALDEQSGATDISLIRIDKEIHGPTDQMKISKSQVLFTQTLADSSRVVAAIRQSQGQR